MGPGSATREPILTWSKLPRLPPFTNKSQDNTPAIASAIATTRWGKVNMAVISVGRLRPEPPDLGQVRVSPDRGGHGGINAGVLVPHQQACGEDAFAARAPASYSHRGDEFLMHHDVVEVAQCILQRF